MGDEGVHLHGMASGQVRRQLAGGPPQDPESAAGLGPTREATEGGGGGPCGVGYIIKRGAPGSSTLWFRKMGVISGNGKEAGGIPYGIPLEGHGEDSVTEVGWYVEEGGGGECSQGKMDANFGEVYQLSTDHGSGVGGIEANI